MLSFAIEDFLAIQDFLFFTCWAFLALLTVWITLIDNINSPSATNNFIAFERVSFYRSSYFHEFSLINELKGYTKKTHFQATLLFY